MNPTALLRRHGEMREGRRLPIGPGDVAVVWPGGSHGLENTGEADLRFIVVIGC